MFEECLVLSKNRRLHEQFKHDAKIPFKMAVKQLWAALNMKP